MMVIVGRIWGWCECECGGGGGGGGEGGYGKGQLLLAALPASLCALPTPRVTCLLWHFLRAHFPGASAHDVSIGPPALEPLVGPPAQAYLHGCWLCICVHVGGVPRHVHLCLCICLCVHVRRAGATRLRGAAGHVRRLDADALRGGGQGDLFSPGLENWSCERGKERGLKLWSLERRGDRRG